MLAAGTLRGSLPLLVAIAFAATACPLDLGPPGVDCGPLSKLQCAKAADGARMMARADTGKTIWALHLRPDRWEIIFADGSGSTVFIDRAAPPDAVPVSSQ
jgi:hypothetical protein